MFQQKKGFSLSQVTKQQWFVLFVVVLDLVSSFVLKSYFARPPSKPFRKGETVVFHASNTTFNAAAKQSDETSNNVGKIERSGLALVRGMLSHSWDQYMGRAYPYDTLYTDKCVGKNDFGSIRVTLIDAADTLGVSGDDVRYAQALERITEISGFEEIAKIGITSFFETGIRVLGGLVALYYQSKELGYHTKADKLLTLAKDLGDRMIESWSPTSDIPRLGFNIRSPKNSKDGIICLAAAGSNILEFGHLTRITKDPKYYKHAKNALVQLFNQRSSLDLNGDDFFSKTGKSSGFEAGVGSQSDSYYEYLFKGCMMFQDDDLCVMWQIQYEAIAKYIVKGGNYQKVHYSNGKKLDSRYQHLASFYAGVQAQMGDLIQAYLHLRTVAFLFNRYGFVPELSQGNPDNKDTDTGVLTYFLRPEVLEAIYFFGNVYKDLGLLKLAKGILSSIEKYGRKKCGYCALKHSNSFKTPVALCGVQHSFFIAETLKYAWLIFDSKNKWRTGSYVFTTEAHPLPIMAKSSRMRFKRANLTRVSEERRKEILSDKNRVCSYEEYQKIANILSFSPLGKGYNWTE